jgi:hypothetical protein
MVLVGQRVTIRPLIAPGPAPLALLATAAPTPALALPDRHRGRGAGRQHLCHADFAGVALSVNDTITFTFKDTLI